MKSLLRVEEDFYSRTMEFFLQVEIKIFGMESPIWTYDHNFNGISSWHFDNLYFFQTVYPCGIFAQIAQMFTKL